MAGHWRVTPGGSPVCVMQSPSVLLIRAVQRFFAMLADVRRGCGKKRSAE